MGGNGKAPVGFAEAVYQANINDRLENMPGLKEHFNNTKNLASFSSGNTEDARKYNLLSGMDYAKMTDRGFFESLPDGLAYAIIDSMKNKESGIKWSTIFLINSSEMIEGIANTKADLIFKFPNL